MFYAVYNDFIHELVPLIANRLIVTDLELQEVVDTRQTWFRQKYLWLQWVFCWPH